MKSPSLATLALLVFCGRGACAQESRFSPHVVFDAGFSGHVWVLNADLLAFDAVATFECLDRLLACLGYQCTNALLTQAEMLSIDPKGIRWTASQRLFDAQARHVVAAEFARLDAASQTAVREFLAVLDVAYGQPFRLGVVWRIALQSVRAEDREDLWPSYEDPLRRWRGDVADTWFASADATADLVARLHAALAEDRASVRGRLWLLLREVWRNHEAVPELCDLRVQNMLGLLLVVRSIEREGLVCAMPLGGECAGQEPTQDLSVSLCREELDAAEALVVAVEHCLSALRWVPRSHVVPVLHQASLCAEVESRLMTLRRTLATCREAYRRCELGGVQRLRLGAGDSLLKRLAGRSVDLIGLEGRALGLSVRGEDREGCDHVVGVVSAAGATRCVVDGSSHRVFTLPVSPGSERRTLAELWRKR